MSLLPRSALLRNGMVMVVDGQQRVREREVQVLQSDPGQLWVQGLAAGERVIAREPALAVAGSQVTARTVTALAVGSP